MLQITSLAFLLVAVHGQQTSTLNAEVHPPLDWEICTAGKVCTTQSGLLTLDASWRNVFEVDTTNYCFYSGNQNSEWNETLCPDEVTCAQNCGLNGADYAVDAGVFVDDSNGLLKINHPSAYDGSNQIGSRVLLMADDTHYQTFNLLNKEFSFQVDVSMLPCELNGALYFVAMDADGGTAKYPTNKAGAKYGTGYCDSQCARNALFVNGMANVNGWSYSTSVSDGLDIGYGQLGSCCSEIDIWEANAISTTLIAHPCESIGQSTCTGNACGGVDSTTPLTGSCDSDGCDFNPYRMGNTTFYGGGSVLDTGKPFTVVTQFLTNDSTSTGTLSEIRRFYVQDGIKIPNPSSNVAGVSGDSITDSYCAAQKSAFGETNEFAAHGGMEALSKAMANGMVLTIMTWRDKYNGMLWLDGVYPVSGDANAPGVARGTCPYNAAYTQSIEGSPSVQFSQIRFGDIGSTI